MEIETGGQAAASVYVVLKDARLPSADTPGNRLAGQIKRTVGRAPIAEEGGPGLLSELLPAPPPPFRGWGRRRSGVPEGVIEMLMDLPAPTRLYRAMSPLLMSRPMSASLRSAADDIVEETMAMPVPCSLSNVIEPSSPAEPGPPKDGSSGAEMLSPPGAEDAEVLFAGLVPVEEGRASLTLRLGRAFTQYLVEAFVVSSGDWAGAEARFQAAVDPYAELQLPAFVHPEDGAIGRLHVGATSGQIRVRLLHDGEAVPLVRDGAPIDAAELIEARTASLTFLAQPGEYEALVEDAQSGGAARAAGRVDRPGKLRHLARTVRFLEPGESISRDADPAIRQLRVLPGLDKPFRALVCATADYGHACCEQTAAKMLAAAALYAMSGDDAKRRDDAEAILLAGVRREKSMWLPGRGFKMYPENLDEPNDYWGQKACAVPSLRRIAPRCERRSAAGTPRGPGGNDADGQRRGHRLPAGLAASQSLHV